RLQQPAASAITRPLVSLQHRSQLSNRQYSMLLHNSGDEQWDIGKANLFPQEGCYRHLVGSVQYRWHGAAGGKGIARQLQAGKINLISRFKIQPRNAE